MPKVKTGAQMREIVARMVPLTVDGQKRRAECLAEDWRPRVTEEFKLKGVLTDTLPNGWEFVLVSLFRGLVRLGWDRELRDARDNNGMLIVKLGPGATQAMISACLRAKEWSRQTCSRCGATDRTVQLNHRWHRLETTCERCHKLLMEEDPNGKHEAE